MVEKPIIDMFWVLFSAGLVFLMQPGFAALESGLTRSKNSINVAIKNITDMGVSIVLFWLVGFGLMFGKTYNGFLGTSDFLVATESSFDKATFFLFQAMFCATAATIVSGMVAERMKYISYIIITAIISLLLYPTFGHWVWGEGGWLAGIGFVDFAGSTVVHSMGAWIGLAAVLVIGARTGRFSEDGQSKEIPGSNLTLTIIGAMLLFFGWFGFNGGSTLVLDKNVALIISNTVLAGAAGSVVALFVGWPIFRKAEVLFLINGLLAGLVAITANCHSVTSKEAILIGSVGGLVMLFTDLLLKKLKIDDAVGAFPVHGAAGIWGTLAVGIFGDPKILGTGLSQGAQVWAQLQGVLVCAAWAFGLSYLLFFILNKISSLRVSVEDEKTGLNIAEHGATTELIDLFQAMDAQAKNRDMSIRVPVEPFTEVGQIAARYNDVMDSLEESNKEKDNILNTVSDGLFIINEDTVIADSYSKSLEQILHSTNLGGKKFLHLITPFLNTDKVENVKRYLRLMFRADMEEEKLHLLSPLRELEVNFDSQSGFQTRFLRFQATRIFMNNKVHALMIAVQDVTEAVQLARRLEEKERTSKNEMALLYNILHIEGPVLSDFLVNVSNDLKGLAAELENDEGPEGYRNKLNTMLRLAHNIKGNSTLIQMDFYANIAHEYEEKIKELQEKETITGADFLPLTFHLSNLKEQWQKITQLVEKLKAFRARPSDHSPSLVMVQAIEQTVNRLARELGKDVEFIYEKFAHEQVPEKHRNLVKDILIQLTKNSLVHGIEKPDKRRQAGKPATGKIELVSLDQNGSFAFSLKDDGQGIYLEGLKQKAIESGRFSPEEVNSWPPGKIARLIFQPGLSTAGETTELAGRGAGMDIIRAKIKEIGGKIKTSFGPGKFCEFQVIMPR